MRVVLVCFALLFGVMPSANALEPVQEIVGKSGVKAWLIEDRSNPIVALRFHFRGGSALDPVEKEGLARLVAATLDEGAGDLTSQAFQARLDSLSSTVSFEATMDGFSGRLQSLTQNVQESATLLKLALTQPRFDPEPVERMRAQILSSLKQAEEDPNQIAAKTLFARIFEGHPYGRGSKGTLEGIAAITSDDLRGFFNNRIAKNNLLIGISGDISAQQAADLIDFIFADLPSTATDWTLPAAVLKLDGQVVVVDKDIPQSSIAFVQEGIKRHDDDFYPTYVLNYILGGGGFASRLYEEVREKRGLVYSVYSYLNDYERAEIWYGGAGTQNARVKETLEVVKNEWQRIATDGVTEEEVRDAKTYLTGSYPLRFDSVDAIASIVLAMQVDDLPMDFLETRNKEVEAVTWEQVNRVARERVHPNRLTFQIVGKPQL